MEQDKKSNLNVIWYVLLIIGLAVAVVLVAPHFFGSDQTTQVAQIKNDFNTIYTALDQYHLDNGMYPSTDQGLQALVTQPTQDPMPQYWKTGGYLNAIPTDPWGQPYQYTNNQDVLRVYSYGSAGENGGTEIDRSNIDQQNNQ